MLYMYTHVLNSVTTKTNSLKTSGARGRAVPTGDPELTFYAISDVHVELKVGRCWFRIPLGFPSP